MTWVFSVLRCPMPPPTLTLTGRPSSTAATGSRPWAASIQTSLPTATSSARLDRTPNATSDPAPNPKTCLAYS